MFKTNHYTERGCGGDPRAEMERRFHGCGGGAHGFRGRMRAWFGHGRCRPEGFDGPHHHGREAGERSDFNLFDDEGDDMHGNERGHRGGPRHWRGKEGFGWEFGGPGGRGPGQSGRPFEQGDLRWLTLDLIAAQPRHGYEIIKAIADALNGHYTPSPGVIYPTLTLLEETGLIVGETQGAKKLYRLTDEGKAEVEAHAADIHAARSRLEQANARFGGPPAPELHRAMHNLRAALQVRLAKGELSPEALGAITAALDRAAGEIERS
ncbi:PadR family transcriptional regulator [Zavarzinella formosa]|uniref:PadR family transcriptional regulator n=1 Tax=Zavarzinella formosa TaxID=360055 RepID=UPI001930BA3C|nr:PadR family transcriptional regulator [Zavarzinella formosa]